MILQRWACHGTSNSGFVKQGCVGSRDQSLAVSNVSLYDNQIFVASGVGLRLLPWLPSALSSLECSRSRIARVLSGTHVSGPRWMESSSSIHGEGALANHVCVVKGLDDMVHVGCIVAGVMEVLSA